MSGVCATARSLQTSMSANVTSTSGPSTSPWMSAENANVSFGQGLIARVSAMAVPSSCWPTRVRASNAAGKSHALVSRTPTVLLTVRTSSTGDAVRQRRGEHAPALHRLGDCAVPLGQLTDPFGCARDGRDRDHRPGHDLAQLLGHGARRATGRRCGCRRPSRAGPWPGSPRASRRRGRPRSGRWRRPRRRSTPLRGSRRRCPGTAPASKSPTASAVAVAAAAAAGPMPLTTTAAVPVESAR